MNELISVIVPCYNVENYIDRCLESIVSQTYGLENIEIICINDASTDNTLSKLNDWEQKYPESIAVIPLEKNQMLGEARNIGLSYATGSLITFVDSDDWLDLRFLELSYSAITAYDVPMVRCTHKRDYTAPQDTSMGTVLKDNSVPCKLFEIKTDSDKRNAIRMMSQNLTAWGKLIRKDFLLENNIYFPKGLAYEDNLWGPLLYAYLSSYCEISLDLYHYYVNDTSLSLKMNAPHHPDFLTVQMMKWNELYARGFMDEYKAEIEYDFLHSCFLDFMKLICVRYEPPSYSLFNLMIALVNEYVPDHASNPYYEQGFTDFQKILLKLLAVETDKDSFYQFAAYVRELGI